ncbi:hypothetical protein [Rhizobium oryzicola]|uniref:Uncharacterized protein n=1 Tax=Rhizobium oryzicola TaxID=1232668 RepID=A0ABT8T3B8_9HYPH|nr:hypothetical protein [Rhizobium oryzicola]MDO1585118.1 hypothetical protein [Rhizobium oryzicola]
MEVDGQILQTRMSIIQRVLERFEKRGIPFDSEPRLHQWLNEWADGTLEMDELWRRYRALLQERQHGSRRVVSQMQVDPSTQEQDQSPAAPLEAFKDPYGAPEPEVVIRPAPEHDSET